jgi:transposase
MTQTLDVSISGLRHLYTRIGQHHLEPGDWPVIGALVAKLLVHEEAKIQRMLAKIAADAAAAKSADAKGETIDVDAPRDASADFSTDDGTSPPEDGTPADAEPGSNDPSPTDPEKPKGHGRNGAAAFTDAKDFFHTLMVGILGSLCECGKACMTKYREKVVIRVLGQPLFAAERHHFEQARCKMCGKIVRAIGSSAILEGIGTSYIVYDYSACAMLSVMHYFGGAPFKRLESLHAGWGIPFADANQWNVVNQSDDLMQPLVNAMEIYGMRNATSLRIDDTGSKVTQLMRQIKAETAALKQLGKSTDDVRTGINATGVYLETPAGTIILYYTGLHHAGEILDLLMKHRQSGGPKLPKVTDGASKNFSPLFRDLLIEAVCNAHAFLKFAAVKDHHPKEYAIAGSIYNQVFANDAVAKKRGMTPQERMEFHAKNSLPLMEDLKAMCAAKITSRLVEPNSKLWGPVTFVLNQWPRLTIFCREPGVPLDTNLIEQNLIMPVRYLSGSFNYKTINGAEVGDRSMSLVATARGNDVEPVSYLEYCLHNHDDLKKNPENYLPWVYREQLAAEAKPPD